MNGTNTTTQGEHQEDQQHAISPKEVIAKECNITPQLDFNFLDVSVKNRRQNSVSPGTAPPVVPMSLFGPGTNSENDGNLHDLHTDMQEHRCPSTDDHATTLMGILATSHGAQPMTNHESITPMAVHLSYPDDEIFFFTTTEYQSSLGTFLYWNSVASFDISNPMASHLLARSKIMANPNIFVVRSHTHPSTGTV
jgi:hypothetical protein